MENIWFNDTESKPSSFSSKHRFWALIFILVLSASALIWVLFFNRNVTKVLSPENLSEIAVKNETAENAQPLPILEVGNSPEEKYRSENFQISRISFGGDAALAVGDSENLPIEVFGVKTDSFLNEKDNESKIAVSWKSNKMTVSEITYSLAGGGGAETVKEDDFGFSHNVILPALEQGSAYVFSIKSYDRWGNSKSFGYYGAYSSAKADSIFELIGKTFGETFGWALNR